MARRIAVVMNSVLAFGLLLLLSFHVIVGSPASRVGNAVGKITGRRSPGKPNFSRFSREDRLASLVRKHLAMHELNITPRDGVAQLPYVMILGVQGGAETVQGHVGALVDWVEDVTRDVLFWSPRKVERARDMARYHEVDELGKYGVVDRSLWSMEQKLSSKWKPLTGPEWYERRNREYFHEGGRQRVQLVLKENFSKEEAEYVLGLNDEFYSAQTDIARLVNQCDDFQSVMESATRYLAMVSLQQPSEYAELALWNFYNYLDQGWEIMDDSVMTLSLNLLVAEVEAVGGLRATLRVRRVRATLRQLMVAKTG